MNDAVEIDADALKAQIAEDPALVLDDAEVMRALLDAAGGGGRNVVDLRGALVARLETRLSKLEKTHRSVIAAAYEALAGSAQVHRAALEMMERRDVPGLLESLLIDAPEVLAVDAARLCLETEAETIDWAEGPAAARVAALPEGAVDAYLALDDAPERDGICLRAAPRESELIFAEDAHHAASEALIRLDLGQHGQGMLALASEDPARFAPEHGTDLVQFLQGAVERLLVRALDAR